MKGLYVKRVIFDHRDTVSTWRRNEQDYLLDTIWGRGQTSVLDVCGIPRFKYF